MIAILVYTFVINNFNIH